MLWGLGAHVIKSGLGPVLIDLMDRGFVSGIAMNGAGLIHDFEIALAGRPPKTSTPLSVRASSAWRKRPDAN